MHHTNVRAVPVLSVPACLLAACHTTTNLPSARPVTAPTSSVVPVPWCVVPGTKVDSAFAVAQARHLLESPDFPLKPQAVVTVVADSVDTNVVNHSPFHLHFEEGFLVRLLPVAKYTLGGGGLVFVNSSTGCPILLIHYE